MKRRALLIGINNYWFGGWLPLQFAESDCHKLAEALSQPQYGFRPEDICILRGSDVDPSQQPYKNMLLYGDIFNRVVNEPVDLFVFFFAGHGEEIEGRSYLVPVDGVQGHIAETCVPLSSILEKISHLQARQKLLIFDICHSAGIRGEASKGTKGLPQSFVTDVENIRGAIVLSACDVNENSHEDPNLKGGVFTHFLCEALNTENPLPPDFSIFDAHKYAEQRVRNWAQQNGVVQNPQIWAMHTPTIYLAPTLVPTEMGIFPSFLTDTLSRTQTIVHVLQRLLNRRQSFTNYCIRIRAALSSFSITDSEHERWGRDAKLKDLMLKEKNLLTEIFRRGASLKVMLSWNLDEYLKLADASIYRCIARYTQLKKFCQEILYDENLVSRATFVRTPLPAERNLLFLDKEYFFEGRKFKVRGSFDATQLIIDSDIIQREIEMFDALFEDSVNYICRERNLPHGRTLNERLLKSIVQDLEEDLARLKSKVGGVK
jgi:hypothetical protein